MYQNLMSIMNLQKRISIIAVLFLGLFAARNSNAQEVYDLSRCIKTGLEQNYSLMLTRNNEEVTRNNYTKGNAGMLPTVTNTNRLNGSLNNTVQNSEAESISSQGIHNTSVESSIDAGLTIFQGFRVQNAYNKLGTQVEISSLNTQMSVENLVAQIVSEYYNYIQQMVLYENLQYAVLLSRERVRIDEERYLLGGASKMQLLQSQVYLNADSSRYALQLEILHTSRIRLNKLMASEELDKLIVLNDSLIDINKRLKFDELLQHTLDYNTGLQIADQNKEISELDYRIIKSRAYPYLTMNAGYGYRFNNYSAGAINSQHQHGLNYGLSMGIDIFDGFNRRREQQNAHIERESQLIRFTEIVQDVKADLYTVFFAYENNLRLLKLEEQNLEVARENLDIALEQYKLGSLAGIELREVQKNLLDAEERLISVKYLAKVAEVSLMQISGSIMDYM
jgi:adhesin transport system outer membrane protein